MEEEILKLIEKSQSNDQEATENLFRIFKPKVTAISREYFLVGAEVDDLVQEGMIGLYKAICVYDKTKNHNFGAFASLCIHRQMQNAVKLANRKKNQPLNTYMPIKFYDGTSDKDDDKYLNLVIVDDSSDIEKNFIEKEWNAIVISKVKNLLSDKQFLVLKMFINGESYLNISKKLDITTKQVDNMIQTIKKKLKTVKGEL